MTYQRWFDEGLVGLLEAPEAAVCTPDCHLGGTCGFCDEWSCPVHGVTEGVGDTDDTHVTNVCVAVAHTSCHRAACRDADCWVDS